MKSDLDKNIDHILIQNSIIFVQSTSLANYFPISFMSDTTSSPSLFASVGFSENTRSKTFSLDLKALVPPTNKKYTIVSNSGLKSV